MFYAWMPSHIGLVGNDTTDRLARDVCVLVVHCTNDVASLHFIRRKKYTSAALAMTVHCRNAEGANSESIQHHDNFLHDRHKYRRHELMVSRSNVVSDRIRLEFRPVWQI